MFPEQQAWESPPQGGGGIAQRPASQVSAPVQATPQHG
jgi:hypothetical protein